MRTPALLSLRLCDAALHAFLLPLALLLHPFHLELLRLLEEAREPLHRLKVGPSKGSVLAAVLHAASEKGLGAESDEEVRWTNLGLALSHA